jgi:DNA-binding response OmpR family regulator
MNQRKNILLVEDDRNLAFVVKDNLLDREYNVHHAVDGQQAIDLFNEMPIDLVLLDVMLPKIDGFAVAEAIRNKDQKTPIIFLTAKDFKEDKIKGFKLGADDYVTKPFVLEELLLRIEAIIRRTAVEEVEQEGPLKIGMYSFDPASLLIQNGKEEVKMTKKEAALLNVLITHKNSVVERSTLLKKVWGRDGYFVGRSMDVYMTKVRKYIMDDPNLEIINIHGVGFKLVENKG